MVEGEAQEISELVLLEALDVAHKEIRRLCAVQNELRAAVGREKRPVVAPVLDEELQRAITEFSLESIKAAVTIPDKMRRQDTLDILLKEAIEKFNTPETDRTRDIIDVFNDIEKSLVRGMILNENKRADGRAPHEIRNISVEVGILPRTHGSALFIRGETQCLAVVTLGTSDDEQKIDSLEGETLQDFYASLQFSSIQRG